MERLRQFVIKNFEAIFVVVLLGTTTAINALLPYKLPFTNFYFLPVIIAGFYLGTRSAVFGAVLAVLSVTAFVIHDNSWFQGGDPELATYMHVLTWGSFLILSGAVVGRLRERVDAQRRELVKSAEVLAENERQLAAANAALRDSNQDLERKVSDRTEDLHRSKEAIEILKGKVEETLYATMDSGVVKLIIEGRLRTEKRPVTVMFADLVGFTNYSEDRSPETVVHELNLFLSAMEPVLMSYRGHIDKFLGDGIMAEFGAPVDHDQCQLQAVLAAIKMQEQVAKLGFEWRMRIGVASGAAILGIIGNRRQSYTAIGDVVNIANRLERACPVGMVTVDEETYKGIQSYFNVGPFHVGEGAEHDSLHAELDHAVAAVDAAGRPEELSPRLIEAARLYGELEDFASAEACLERGLRADPEHRDLKLALADLVLRRDRQGTMRLKGRKKPVRAYCVTGLKDVLLDRTKVSQTLYDRCLEAVDSLGFPPDLILPVEGLDGCIGHSRLVAAYAWGIARELGLPPEQTRVTALAGLVADVGKEIIPHRILNRHGSLSESEMTAVKQHPDESVRVLKSLGYDDPALIDIVRATHERMNGSGYPNGLKGERIPLGARIVAVADAFAALTSRRPYREKLEPGGALDEIHQGVDRGMFDLRIVVALAQLVDGLAAQKSVA